MLSSVDPPQSVQENCEPSTLVIVKVTGRCCDETNRGQTKLKTIPTWAKFIGVLMLASCVASLVFWETDKANGLIGLFGLVTLLTALWQQQIQLNNQQHELRLQREELKTTREQHVLLSLIHI